MDRRGTIRPQRGNTHLANKDTYGISKLKIFFHWLSSRSRRYKLPENLDDKIYNIALWTQPGWMKTRERGRQDIGAV